MEEKKSGKKKIIIIVAAVVVVALVVGIILASTFGKKPYDVVTGKWAVVYRYVDDNGSPYNDFTSDEFVEITKDEFTYYKGTGSDCKAVFNSKINYHENTSQDNRKLQKINRISSYHISLDEKGQKDLGVSFYGSDCMVFGRYSGATASYAVLVRCSEIGKNYEVSGSADGNWVSAENANTSITISANSIGNKIYNKTNENGLIKFEGNWEDSTFNKVDSTKDVIAAVYVSDEYIVLLSETTTKYTDKTQKTETFVNIFLKG